MIRISVAGLALAAWIGSAAALTVEVDYGNRLIHEGWYQPPAEFQEGGVVATFTADAPVDTAVARDGLERIDAQRWAYTFAWDTTDSLGFFFEEEGGGEVVALRALPGWPPFVPGQHAAPVITLDGDPAALWDPFTGIYVWGQGPAPNWDQRGSEWERDFTLNWWDTDGTLRHQRPVGVRINGNWSRNLVQKSLRLYFDHHGEPNTIEDTFFGPDPEEFEHLILRCGARRSELFIHDPLAVEIFTDLGHPVSRWTPVEAYLNGEYWGLYHLRERPSSPWAERILGLSGDYVLIKDHTATVPGHIELWEAFLAQVLAEPAPEDNAFFEWLDASLDLESYLDWVLFQIWSATADNGGRYNKVVYRPEGGRWHFMIYDQDAMFHAWNRTIDYFRFFTAATQAEYDARVPPAYYQEFFVCEAMFGLFRQTMSNARGRRLCRERWQQLREQHLTDANLGALLDEIVAVNEPSEPDHQARWETYAPLAWFREELATYIPSRTAICDADYASFMTQWMDPVELDLFTATGDDDGAHLSWHTERETDLAGWVVARRLDATGVWQDIADADSHAALVGRGGPATPAAYAFTDPDAIPGEPYQYRLAYEDSGGRVTIKPWFEAVAWPLTPPALVINEYLASNDTTIADETGAFEDWVEIFNPGTEPVSLTGLYLTDDLTEPFKWAFPPTATIDGGGFLLVWCDDDEEDGPLHASFKLDADGEAVGLFAAVDGLPVALDSREFGPQVTDVSEGRIPDGGPVWMTLTTPTPGASNVATGVPNGSPTIMSLSAWPNPFNPACRLTFTLPEGQAATLEIYDLAGRRVRCLMAGDLPAGTHAVIWRGCDDRGRALPSGVYHARVMAGGRHCVRKLTLVR